MGEMHGNSDGPALDDEQFCGAVPHGLNGLEKFLQHSASSSATVTRFQVEDEVPLQFFVHLVANMVVCLPSVQSTVLIKIYAKSTDTIRVITSMCLEGQSPPYVYVGVPVRRMCSIG